MKVRPKRFLIGISTIILTIFMIIFIDLQIILKNLSKISIFGIILFIFIYTIAFVFRTVRLKLIFHGLNTNASYLVLFGSFGIGWMINELTPGKVGDFVRMEFMSQKDSNINLRKSICGVSIERFLDLLILFLITSFAMLFMYLNNVKGTSALNLHFYIGIAAFLLIGGFILMLIIFYKTDWFLNVLGRISKKLRNLIKGTLKNFLKDISNFRKNKKNVVIVIALSILIWFTETLTLVILFYLAGYEINILIIMLAQVITFFTKTFPITPGGWFISELAGGFLIYLFYPSISFNNILSIFLLDHILRLAFVLIYGLFSTLAFNFKFRKIELKHLKENN